MIRRRRRRQSPMIPVASMGDIAFLLIIFFMLVSNFVKQSNIEVTNPVSPDIDTIEPLQVTVILDKNGVIWLQGNVVPVDALEGAIGIILEGRKDKRVELKVDRNLAMDQVKPVRNALVATDARLVLVGDAE